jgi:hypothetical protein
MPAVGKVTVKKVKGDIVVSDESGASYTFPRPTGRPLLLDIDPRIDLTKPIYEQVMKLQTKDKAASARAKKRKRQAAVA